jgi:membrane protein DedA with SNARE-associated domain
VPFDLPALVDSYGYVAVAIGAFLEGETVLALAGLAANRGYLELFPVIAIAAVAGFAGDQLYFFLGRRHGARLLARFPDAAARAARFDALLARWHAPLIIAIRFMYGFRIVGPILLGMGRCERWKFVFYNAIGAMLWAPLVAGVGFAFGAAMEAALHDLKRLELWGFVVLVVGALVLGAVRVLQKGTQPP